MSKLSIFTACLAGTLLLPLSLAHADRDGEFGVFGGYHIFNDDNELGVDDSPDAESMSDAVTFGVRAAWAIIGLVDLEGELAITPSSSTDSGVDVVALGWRGHALVHFREGKFRPFALAGVGAQTSSSEDQRAFGSDTDFVVHGGLGFKYQVEDNWGVRADARLLLPPSSAGSSVTADTEFLVGLYKNFGATKSAAQAPVDSDGDGDGVPDSQDACPADPEDLDGNADEDGCPETEDRDGDGVADDVDACPGEAGLADKSGCPDGDQDSDGIADSVDQCADQAEDADGFQDEDGCPDVDNDGDGVADADDKCPEELETANGFEDTDGCADELPEAVKNFSGAIDGVKFLSGKEKIRSSSFKTLDKAVAVFSEFGNLRVEVQGHTDNRGSDEVNSKLSQDRAQAVVDYLVGKGIGVDRLVAKGYGSSVPVADNAQKSGRDQNRRVEFQLIK